MVGQVVNTEEAERRFAAARPAMERKLRTYAQRAATGHVHGRMVRLGSNDINEDVQDILQELLVVLWRACERYDPDNGASFNTYLQSCVQNRLYSMARAAGADKRKVALDVVSLDAEAVSEAIERRRSTPSAEDVALERLEPFSERTKERLCELRRITNGKVDRGQGRRQGAQRSGARVAS